MKERELDGTKYCLAGTGFHRSRVSSALTLRVLLVFFQFSRHLLWKGVAFKREFALWRTLSLYLSLSLSSCLRVIDRTVNFRFIFIRDGCMWEHGRSRFLDRLSLKIGEEIGKLLQKFDNRRVKWGIESLCRVDGYSTWHLESGGNCWELWWS